jgi:GT2 family glycosyltransferase
MKHDVLILTKNNLDLTQRCVESVRAQEVPTRIHVYDNLSTDGTEEWLVTEPDIINHSVGIDLGVSAAWNRVLSALFDDWSLWSLEHVLVLNNDVVLPPWYLRALLCYHVPFVTGVAVDLLDAIKLPAPAQPLVPHPDFSAFLIHREAWERVGKFDERMELYAGDCDWHVRAHRLGVPLWKANVPYYHVNSQTMKRASESDQRRISERACMDREEFRKIYGCLPGTPEYAKLFL